MTKPDSQAPLFVDLDGTFIKSDWMLEAILTLLRNNPLSLFTIVSWLFNGKAALKRKLAKSVSVNLESIPLNTEFYEFLLAEKKKNRKLILISASDQQVVDSFKQAYPIFDDGIGSDGTTNLKAKTKLARIRQLADEEGIAYAGNSNADLVIWQTADEAILVNVEQHVSNKAKRIISEHTVTQEFDKPATLPSRFLRAMRPHQWLKNCLIFLPLILSHQLTEPDLLAFTLLAFVSFSLCASSVYLLNDMLDIENDRQHVSKSKRPFAAGTLPLTFGFLGAPSLFGISLILAGLVGTEFLSVLVGYWLVTCIYSFYLKRLYIVDAVTLSLLYTLRIIAGSAAIDVVTTNWLFAFSVFLFFGLALLKRTIELRNLLSDSKTATSGRDYSTDQLQLVAILGVMSSIAAILVFTVYINAPATTHLYELPSLLWAICPLLIAMLARVWIKAYSGTLDEDPVLFASHDRPSQVMLLLSIFILWAAI